ncbi:ATP-dependent DNA ligase [Rubrivivax gelatinosus]|uniref:ATP-dependent DNA ligase n=1 Tax=Rubrivivax gelatinosus TaxID=28068 RepID=A0ABS1DUQ4_RUBGE|nr:ATP-dependent DNA ligase [Rubrivivax gelatinosus]MBK1713350.1 ATP-dependent DNA ligase [Rubrivivax gelatinosus]
MRRFAALYQQLDASTATGDKVAALVRYFGAAPPEDAAWAVYFLAGGRPRQVVTTALLRATAEQCAALDDWLFEACYQAAGDLAETIAHVLPPPPAGGADEAGLATWVERLLALRGLAPAEQAAHLAEHWSRLDAEGRFLHVKLIGGGFRVGVSRLLVQRALAEAAGLDAKLVAQRLMGYTDARATPSGARYLALVAPAGDSPAEAGQPYPFFLAHPLPAPPETLGAPGAWLAEWKYDGIRAQLVRRAGRCWIWSRGEELITERFPEVAAAAATLPDGTVLDGELLVWRAGDERPAPFTLLQQRITRKALPKKLLAETPVVFVAYDLLEADGADCRGQPLQARRARLLALLEGGPLRVSPEVVAGGWAALAALRAGARERGVEGLMLKQRDGAYGSGRTKLEGVWWKWKVEPFAVDCVLIYAQAGHGRRAGVYTDYSFAVWNRAPRDAAEAQAVVEAIAAGERNDDADALRLVAFAKAYSGLSDAEFAAVDRVIRQTTLEKFGPVRSVRPTLVFELGFEGLNSSNRHKSGIAVRFPRMLRLRPDKPLHEADTLATLRALMAP